MNKIGKQNIIEAFEERFKKGYLDWSVFKNKYDTSRKKYTKFRKLIKNKTCLGFDSMGRVDMSDDWWSEREKGQFLLSLLCIFFPYICFMIVSFAYICFMIPH